MLSIRKIVLGMAGILSIVFLMPWMTERFLVLYITEDSFFAWLLAFLSIFIIEMALLWTTSKLLLGLHIKRSDYAVLSVASMAAALFATLFMTWAFPNWLSLIDKILFFAVVAVLMLATWFFVRR